MVFRNSYKFTFILESGTIATENKNVMIVIANKNIW